MYANEAVARMLEREGVTQYRAAQLAGMSRQQLNMATTGTRMPNARTMARIAATCGYALALLPADDVPPSALVIDAPAPAEQ